MAEGSDRLSVALSAFAAHGLPAIGVIALLVCSARCCSVQRRYQMVFLIAVISLVAFCLLLLLPVPRATSNAARSRQRPITRSRC